RSLKSRRQNGRPYFRKRRFMFNPFSKKQSSAICLDPSESDSSVGAIVKLNNGRFLLQDCDLDYNPGWIEQINRSKPQPQAIVICAAERESISAVGRYIDQETLEMEQRKHGLESDALYFGYINCGRASLLNAINRGIGAEIVEFWKNRLSGLPKAGIVLTTS